MVGHNIEIVGRKIFLDIDKDKDYVDELARVVDKIIKNLAKGIDLSKVSDYELFTLSALAAINITDLLFQEKNKKADIIISEEERINKIHNEIKELLDRSI